MGKSLKYVLIAGLILGLSGCEFKPVKEGEDIDEQAAQQERDTRYGVDEGGPLDIKALDDPNSPVSVRVIYFPLDSVQVSNEDREVISAHARLLSSNPDVTVVLEGHADERGTREYNLALGERRALAARNYLLQQGVAPERMRIRSFGETQRVSSGTGRIDYARDRRTEFIFTDTRGLDIIYADLED